MNPAEHIVALLHAGKTVVVITRTAAVADDIFNRTRALTPDADFRTYQRKITTRGPNPGTLRCISAHAGSAPLKGLRFDVAIIDPEIPATAPILTTVYRLATKNGATITKTRRDIFR